MNLSECMTIENISDAEFAKLQSDGWVLVSVDNSDMKFIYNFERRR
ncbi:hypothetical protein [Treponema sp.]